MRIVRQSEIKNIVTSLPLADYDLYDNDKTYNDEDKCSLDNKNWFCARDNVKGKNPKDNEGILWVSQPTNAYAMFSYADNCITKFTNNLTVNFDVESLNKICFFGLKAQSIDIKITSADEVKNIHLDLRNDTINSLQDYFFSDFKISKSDFVEFLNIYDAKVELTFTSIGEGEIAYIFVGNEYDLGFTLYEGDISFRSAVKKTVNEWGDVTFQHRSKKNFKILNTSILAREVQFDYLIDFFSEIDGEVCVFIADETKAKENLQLLGYWDSAKIPISQQYIEYPVTIKAII